MKFLKGICKNCKQHKVIDENGCCVNCATGYPMHEIKRAKEEGMIPEYEIDFDSQEGTLTLNRIAKGHLMKEIVLYEDEDSKEVAQIKNDNLILLIFYLKDDTGNLFNSATNSISKDSIKKIYQAIEEEG